MSPRTIWLLALLVVSAYPAAANTYYVGNCKSGSFPTISAAVNSPSVAPGSTIMICAGSYTEQPIISKDLTLKGLDGSTGAGVEVIPPNTMQTTTSRINVLNADFGLIAPVIWVTSGTVNIQNVAVDVAPSATCPARNVGFYYATGASGTLNHVGFFGKECGVGIWAENASFTQTAVTVENSYLDGGIIAGSLDIPDGTLTVTIKGNQVFPTSPDGSFGIYMHGVSGTVEGNVVSGPRWTGQGSFVTGLSVAAIEDDGVSQTDVTISGNTILISGNTFEYSFVSIGVLIKVAGATVKSNKISGPEYGIELSCLATASGNTISNTGYGISDVPAGSTGVNTFYSVDLKIGGGC
jgi:hypothetical protein